MSKGLRWLPVKVTREHIEEGIECDNEDCAVSLAIAEAMMSVFGVVRTVQTDEDEIRIDYHDPIRTPPDVAEFLPLFDGGGGEPFEFLLDLGQEWALPVPA